MAWAPPMLNGKTTIRGGFGIYYGGNQNDDFSDPMESAVPRYSVTSTDIPTLSFPLVAFLDPRFQLYSPKAIDRHRKDLYYENWDFMVQQQLPKDWLVQVGYTGSEGHHSFERYPHNLIYPPTGQAPPTRLASL